jgi:magnesium-transporting ATPase (P-type)
MTGETEPMKKDIILKCVHFRNTIIADGGKKYASAHEVPSPILLSGTRVLSGDGKMIIIAVGKYSAIGKIQNLLEKEEESATPL